MDAVMQQQGPRPVAEVLQRTRQLAGAIDFAASAGIHHGMLAPCDVILDGERTGVTGVGLAQALIKAGAPAEAAALYASPQRLAGAPPALADDIYSLAAIALELLIGTPRDPDQDARALRAAQGLAERRRIPRPAPHETRMFTTIPGVDAGKLRACFAAAFSEEPGGRPSTAAEFVESLQDALSNKRVTVEPAASVAEDAATLEPRPRPERVAAEGRAARRRRARARRREMAATSRPSTQESPEHVSRQRTPESRPAPAEPLVDVDIDIELLAEVAPPRARSLDQASLGISIQPGSRAFLATAVVVVSFAAGFGGGFVVGHFSTPAAESVDVSQRASVAESQPSRVAVEVPAPVAATTQTTAPIPEATTVSTSEPAAAAAPPPEIPVVDSGRLLVRSTPAGATVMVDGQSHGVTPLALRELTFGTHTVEVSHAGHDTRQRRVTLSERRPARSIDFELRPTSAPAAAAAATNSAGSLQVASRPSGAQVFVDDDLIGTTPLLLSNVAGGSRRLRIELSGYKIWTTSVQIKPSARMRVSASLEP
jgi:serine/threonine protein kinase